MATNENETMDEMDETTVETETAAVTTTDGAAGATPVTADDTKGDDRFKFVTHPTTGELVKRKDYIADLWKTGQYTRGEIAKHLTEITGKKVPYQIVFQATKGKPGGKPKDATPVVPPAAS